MELVSGHIWLRARQIGLFTWVFHTILKNKNLNIFFRRFSITIIFICMLSLILKKIYTTFLII